MNSPANKNLSINPIPTKDEEYTYRYYLVAFLDILGQREKLRQIKSLPTDEKEFEKFINLVRETQGTVLKFRKTFLKFFKGFFKKRPIPENLTEDQKTNYLEIKQRAEKLKPVLNTFSDTVVIYVQLSDENGIIQADGILSSILAIAGCFHVLMSGGNIFRGGLEIGLACRIGQNEIYGPALIRAYDLESKIAKYPRIVLGEDLVDFLQVTSQLSDPDIQSSINKAIAQKCLDLIMIDGDGRYAIDYLGKEFRDMVKGNFPDLFNTFVNFLEKAYGEINRKKDTKLYLRYLCLEDYFQKRIELWQP